MKNYYNVTFAYSGSVRQEYTWCANIAHAENEDAVGEHYKRYDKVIISAAHDYDVEVAKRKGMPIIEV